MASLMLKNYSINKISFELNRGFIQNQQQIIIRPTFSRKVLKVDDNSAIIIISATIPQNNITPFFGTIEINGFFESELWEKTDEGRFIMVETSTTILFPYLRQALSTTTSLLNIPPYVLPVINTYDLFNKKEGNENDSAR